ncbi:3'-5' exoribonuclease [Proteus sp. STS61-E]
MANPPNSPVISIGAVFFDHKTGDLGASTEINISLESSMLYGEEPDASTIMWWMKQSNDAQTDRFHMQLIFQRHLFFLWLHLM